MKLIVNADDFGFCESVNYGILEAHKQGIVTSTTLLVTTPGTQHAVELAKANPSLKIGLHLNMTLGKPMTNCPSLIKENGEFYKPKENPNQENFIEEEIYQEFKAQYIRFKKLMGREPTHVDSHLYAHQKYPKAFNAARRLADEIKVPIRDGETTYYPRPYFFDFFKAGTKTSEELIDLVLKMDLNHEYAELMVHPAYVSSYLLNKSSYNLARLKEYDALTDPRLKQFIKDNKIELIGFDGIIIKKGI